MALADGEGRVTADPDVMFLKQVHAQAMRISLDEAA